MKTFTQQQAMEAADSFRKNAISQIEDLIASLNRSLTNMKEMRSFDLCDNPELRMKQVRQEVEQAKLMSKLADMLS